MLFTVQCDGSQYLYGMLFGSSIGYKEMTSQII